MKKQLMTALCALGLAAAVLPATAGDDPICLDCHVPEEDWEGLSADEILAEARDPEIKRHKDNQELGEEELRQMIEAMLAE